MGQLNQAFRVALSAMSAHRGRTLLSTLGVVIGVSALAAIFALGDGLERFSRQQIARTTDLQMITVRPVTTEIVEGVRIRRRDPVSLTRADAVALQGLLGKRAAVSLVARSAEWIWTPADTASIAVELVRTTPEAHDLLRAPLAAGRFLKPGDSTAAVAVASHALTDRIGRPGRAALGATVETRWGDVAIVGVLQSDSTDSSPRLVVPFGYGGAEANEAMLAVRAHRVEDVPDLHGESEAWSLGRFGGSDRPEEAPVAVTSNESRARQARRAMLVFKLIMGSIAGISLVVGGIGIMNVLLASVSERTREIGIRKAVGARQQDIRLQFIAESLAIAGIGSVLGLLLGMIAAVGVAAIVRRLTEAPVVAVFTWPSLLFAGAAALLVGLAFGSWPAIRAGRMSPIESLRNE